MSSAAAAVLEHDSRATSPGSGSPTPPGPTQLLDDPALGRAGRPLDDIEADGLRRRPRRRRRPRPARCSAWSGCWSRSRRPDDAEHGRADASLRAPTRGHAETGCWPCWARPRRLGDHLVAPPRRLGSSTSTAALPAHRGAMRVAMLAAVGADPTRAPVAALRGTTASTRCGSPTGAQLLAIAALGPHRADPSTCCRTSPPRWPTSPAPRSRRRWPSPATRWRRRRARRPARGDRHGQVRRPRAELRQRRRRHLRRRAGATACDEDGSAGRRRPRWPPA